MVPVSDESTAAPVRVLYLGGIGRSGSTVLGRMLGSVDGAVSVGEVVHLWGRGLRDDHLCGCGRRFSECPFWRAVGDEAFGSWSRVVADDMAGLQHAVDRNRYLPWLVSRSGPDRYQADLADYVGVLARLYRAMARVTGGGVLVDTSKNVPYAWLLRRVPEIDLRVVHLVRDSRGVAHSWAKTSVRRPEMTDKTEYMDAVPATTMAVRWSFDNTMFDLLRMRDDHVIRLRYEDVVTDPLTCLQRVADLAGLDPQPALRESLARGEFTPTEQHEVSGNPMRFVDGPVVLGPDDAWRTAMPARDRRTVTVLTAPLIARYGYWRRAGSRSESHGAAPISR
jgi:Sulfotransferase family